MRVAIGQLGLLLVLSRLGTLGGCLACFGRFPKQSLEVEVRGRGSDLGASGSLPSRRGEGREVQAQAPSLARSLAEKSFSSGTSNTAAATISPWLERGTVGAGRRYSFGRSFAARRVGHGLPPHPGVRCVSFFRRDGWLRVTKNARPALLTLSLCLCVVAAQHCQLGPLLRITIEVDRHPQSRLWIDRTVHACGRSRVRCQQAGFLANTRPTRAEQHETTASPRGPLPPLSVAKPSVLTRQEKKKVGSSEGISDESAKDATPGRTTRVQI